jgi:acyl carrier protein phosphodiesterase
MNFLAHLFLSGNPGELMVGNFIADSVRGNSLLTYSPAIQNGIRLHRLIDAYTDQHDIPAQSKKMLYPGHGKYASVITDIFYDHFLAVHWRDYADMEFRLYINTIYDFLGKHYSSFPDRSKRFYNYMIQYDILYAYRSVDGIDQVLKGMARRARFNSGMEKASIELQKEYHLYSDQFKLFFPELRAFVSAHLKD